MSSQSCVLKSNSWEEPDHLFSHRYSTPPYMPQNSDLAEYFLQNSVWFDRVWCFGQEMRIARTHTFLVRCQAPQASHPPEEHTILRFTSEFLNHLLFLSSQGPPAESSKAQRLGRIFATFPRQILFRSRSPFLVKHPDRRDELPRIRILPLNNAFEGFCLGHWW